MGKDVPALSGEPPAFTVPGQALGQGTANVLVRKPPDLNRSKQAIRSVVSAANAGEAADSEIGKPAGHGSGTPEVCLPPPLRGKA